MPHFGSHILGGPFQFKIYPLYVHKRNLLTPPVTVSRHRQPFGRGTRPLLGLGPLKQAPEVFGMALRHLVEA